MIKVDPRGANLKAIPRIKMKLLKKIRTSKMKRITHQKKMKS